MRLHPQHLASLLSLVAISSCSGGPDAPVRPTPVAQAVPGVSIARALVRSAPADWQSHWQRLRKMKSNAVPAIHQALEENPGGLGAQAAIHLLGEAADARSKELLLTIMKAGNELGAEAALALGKLGDPTTTSSLKATVESAATPMTTRAAAAAALITMGEGTAIASFLEAVFLAASPSAQASNRRHKIPKSKTRWAHERYMIIESLRQRYDGETFGLDEDSSWPAMQKAAAAMSRRLKGK